MSSFLGSKSVKKGFSGSVIEFVPLKLEFYKKIYKKNLLEFYVKIDKKSTRILQKISKKK